MARKLTLEFTKNAETRVIAAPGKGGDTYEIRRPGDIKKYTLKVNGAEVLKEDGSRYSTEILLQAKLKAQGIEDLKFPPAPTAEEASTPAESPKAEEAPSEAPKPAKKRGSKKAAEAPKTEGEEAPTPEAE